MTFLRFILYSFTFIGLLASAGAFVLTIIILLRFPLMLIAVLLACGMFVCVMRKMASHR
ncbi:hypothetical protein SAMN05421553_0506 [Pseudomonas anguilliseptica]|uniref:Uncharacterized protein n=1 Tax=Pseudomonas anguilliseptica TaxID=53406 RepID=A0A1H4QPB1_PSEAG|nr:hypothetical protein SAMN05421553_0506 [Pseudomonas anguilliseptica]